MAAVEPVVPAMSDDLRGERCTDRALPPFSDPDRWTRTPSLIGGWLQKATLLHHRLRVLRSTVKWLAGSTTTLAALAGGAEVNIGYFLLPDYRRRGTRHGRCG